MKEFVYIVDDDEAVRDSLRWLLEWKWFLSKVFSNAEELLDFSKTQSHGMVGLFDSRCKNARNYRSRTT